MTDLKLYDPALMIANMRDRIVTAADNFLSDQLLNWLDND